MPSSNGLKIYQKDSMISSQTSAGPTAPMKEKLLTEHAAQACTKNTADTWAKLFALSIMKRE